MKNNKIITFVVILLFVLAAGAGIFFAKEQTKDSNKETAKTEEETPKTEETVIPTDLPETGIIFFYGSTCPHCKNVEKFFADNKVTTKIKFDQKEVYNSKTNSNLMTEKQNLCKNLSEDDKGGVPFLYTPNTCIVGDQPIIDYFKGLLNIK